MFLWAHPAVPEESYFWSDAGEGLGWKLIPDFPGGSWADDHPVWWMVLATREECGSDNCPRCARRRRQGH